MSGCNNCSEMFYLQNYQVDRTEEGSAGIQKYAEALTSNTPYDVVLLDLTIPGGIGGKEAIKKLLEIDPAAKVIAISGYSTDPIMANYVDYGFCGRLTKPFQLRELRSEFSRAVLNDSSIC